MASVHTKIRQRILERDGNKCIKCQRQEALDIHHIYPECEGGDSSDENLAVLCKGCHEEWHAFETVSKITFDEWLQLPILNLLATFFLSSKRKFAENVSFAEAGRLVFLIDDMLKFEKSIPANNAMNGDQNSAG